MRELLLLITGLISGLVSAVITYFLTLTKVRLDLTVEYDKKLRAKRFEAYKLLWKELKPLARYSPGKPLTYEIVRETSKKMRDWYFDEGGIYLSQQSREPYFKLKKLMKTVIDDENLRNRNEDLAIYLNKILEQGTVLRENLSDDIGTRREPFV